ncbi:MAG: aminotransferase class I/II-fold pyridoxal phosphate-dependent enzyme [Tannerellaceae bacterium]|jgi:methionine-gamma-lyase|nr:aminotransferase class I/II-fold pyridoxal phosphate-dependent enzyme [Tannerellaceae bacterium]
MENRNFSTQISTKLIHAGESERPSVSRSKALPITMTSVFSFDSAEDLEKVYEGEAAGYIYTRNGNPVHDALAEIICAADGSEAALGYSSGMGAISLALLSQVQAGDHIVAANVIYGGSFAFLSAELSRFGVQTTFAEPSPESFESCIRDNTRVLYVETIANPTMEVTDLQAMAELARRHEARLIVDNSFATPIICRPLELGADLAVYSATKYLGGHSDVTAGVVSGSAELIAKVYASGLLFGPTLSPFDGWLLVRSMRTLGLRMKQHSLNAMALARFFEQHPAVGQVCYPGLESSPTHLTAKRMFSDGMYGGMLSISLKGGEGAARKLLGAMPSVRFAPSLGGVATTTSWPARTSHRAFSADELAAAGISAGMVRISAGLEDAADLIREFEAGLSRL